MSTIADEIDALFSEWNKPDSPGSAVAVIQRGLLIHCRGYGMADLEHAIQISKNSVFDVGSISKQFVAMSVALLARQGKLSLDDNIQKYIPEIQDYGHPIIIRHLIHHTSGLRDYLTLMELAGLRLENKYSDKEILGLIARQKELNFQPGEEFLYCNSGYLLLAEIVKRSSGQSLREFADENIFMPLGMKNTFFHDDFSEIVTNRAVGYSPKESGGFRIDMSLLDAVGDGGVHTTIEDLCLWDANFYHNIVGGYGQKLIEEMINPGTLNSGEVLKYAFGLGIATYRGLRVIGHGGAWMGYRAEMIRFPEQEFSVICLFNLGSVNPTKLAKQIADIYLTEDFPASGKNILNREQKLIELSAPELEAKIGFYRSLKNWNIWKLTVQSGKLMANVFDMDFQIAPIHFNQFISVDIPFDISVKFEEYGPQGTCMMHVQIEGSDPDVLEKVKTASLEIGQLTGYSGDYYCEELGANYKILTENCKLILHYGNSSKEHLELVICNLFKGSYGTFEFICNAQNEVMGFNLKSESVRNIHFIKQ